MKSSRDIIKTLKADGWHLIKVTGDHHQFRHLAKPGKVTVPHPVRDIGDPLLKSIERQSQLKLR